METFPSIAAEKITGRAYFLTLKRIQDYYSAMLARVIISKTDLPKISINFFVYSDISRTAESEKISL